MRHRLTHKLKTIDDQVELFFPVSLLGVMFGISLLTVSEHIRPRITTSFYETVATVCATALIAVAIDNRNIPPSTLRTPRQAAGLLLGISMGLLIGIVTSLVAIGTGRGSCLLFGVTAGAVGTAIFLLLIAMTVRAAGIGATIPDEERER